MPLTLSPEDPAPRASLDLQPHETPDRETKRLAYLRDHAKRAHRSYEPSDWVQTVLSLRGRSGADAAPET